MDGDGPPPPPPPHGHNPRPPGGGLPNGNYDIFIIPPHSAGGGFVYLPSLQPHVNSFVAGIVVTVIAMGIGTVVWPVLRDWIMATMGGHGSGVLIMVVVVGLGAWALGRSTAENTSGSSAGAGAGNANTAGAGAGADRQQYRSNANGPDSHYYSTPPPPPQPEPEPQAPPPPPPPQPEPEPPPKPKPSAAQSGWEKAREETRRREEERKRTEELKKKREAAQKMREEAEAQAKKAKEEAEAQAKKAQEEAERNAKAKAEKEKWEQARAREKEQRERDARERIAKEKEAREKEAKEKETKEREARIAAELAKAKAEKEAAERKKAALERIEKLKAERTRAASTTSAKPGPTASKTYVPPTSRSAVGTEDTYSYRPYDTQSSPTVRAKSARPSYKTSASSISGLSESSYAPSVSTARTTPPLQRGPYSTTNPDLIQIRAVYLTSDSFPGKPISVLVAGEGGLTDGLVLEMRTEGLFIDDVMRGVPQREWDCRAWTLKSVEDGAHKSKGLHVFRALVKDMENKRYTFVIDSKEAYKVPIGIKRLKQSSLVKSLNSSTMKDGELNKVLSGFGW